MCAAIAATMTAGPRAVSANGRMRTCCRISGARNPGRAGRTDYRGGDGPLTTQLDPLRRSAGRSLRRGRRARRLSVDRRLQWPQPGRLLPLAVDDPRRPPLQRGAGLSEAGDGADQSARRGRRAGEPRALRAAIAPSALNIFRSAANPVACARDARSASLAGGVDQLAAAPDALGHRRSGRVARPRHRGESAAPRRRQESAGPHLGGP